MNLSPAQLNSGRDKQYYSPVWLTNKLGNNVAWHSALDHLLSCQSKEETNNATIRCLFVTRHTVFIIKSVMS